MIQATVAVYPLGQADHADVDRAINALRGAGVRATYSQCTPRSLATRAASSTLWKLRSSPHGRQAPLS